MRRAGIDLKYLMISNRRKHLMRYMRPCMIHGPGNKGNLNLLYGVVSKGIPWPLGAFENRRSFTSIGNLQEVIKGLMTKEGDYKEFRKVTEPRFHVSRKTNNTI